MHNKQYKIQKYNNYDNFYNIVCFPLAYFKASICKYLVKMFFITNQTIFAVDNAFRLPLKKIWSAINIIIAV